MTINLFYVIRAVCSYLGLIAVCLALVLHSVTWRVRIGALIGLCLAIFGFGFLLTDLLVNQIPAPGCVPSVTTTCVHVDSTTTAAPTP